MVIPRKKDFCSDRYTVRLGTSAGNAPANKASGYEGQLAENILGIWMQPLDQARRPITSNASNGPYPNGEFDSTMGYRTVLTNGTNAVSYTFARALPASVEVAVVAVDAEVAPGG